MRTLAFVIACPLVYLLLVVAVSFATPWAAYLVGGAVTLLLAWLSYRSDRKHNITGWS